MTIKASATWFFLAIGAATASTSVGCSGEDRGGSGRQGAGGGGAAGRGGDSGPGGGGGAGGKSGNGGDGRPTGSPWSELTEPVITVAGGSSRGSSGVGHDGGAIQIASRGGITVGPSASSVPPPPGSSPVPTNETVLTGALAADVTRAETIRVSGDLRLDGADPIRTLTSTAGDVIIEGSLRAASLGSAAQSIALNAPAGTVFVAGSVDTSGADASRDVGDAGAALTITARQIVVTGRLAATGGPGASAGGPGGAIALTATALVRISGSVDASGGDSSGGDARAVGGTSGDLRLTAGGDAQVLAKVRLRGGAATSAAVNAEGGAGGTFSADADGALWVAGTVDARGGPAAADETSGAAAMGGAAGTLLIGMNAPPGDVQLPVPLTLRGGAGTAAAGNGGTLTLTALGGDLRLGGTVDVGGGDSGARPGNGGAVHGRAGPDAGGIALMGLLTGRGGAATPGAAAVDGGAGAEIKLEVVSLTGAFSVEPTGQLIADGGGAGGAGRGGGGGGVTLLTRDGDVSMAGQLQTRGGGALDPGGNGGQGGPVNIWSDTNFNGVGGNLTIQPSGIIDASGGPGTAAGGSARNNGGGGVALFPAMQDQIAVLLNSETVKGGPQDGTLSNLGLILATGAPGGGSGGDVMFHGRQPNGREDPLPGRLSLDGHAPGLPGDFAAE